MEPPEFEGLSSIATLTIYPTALKARAAVHAALPASGVAIGGAATTFPELTDALAAQLGVTGRVLAPELALWVLEAAIGDLPDLSVARGGRGIVRELQDAIGELKAAAIAPDDVRAAAHGVPTAEAAARVEEVARVYAAYERRLRTIGAIDRPGREWEVAERLAACVERGTRPPVLVGVTRVVFAEIYDFSVLQFLIATALIRLVGDAELVALAHPENVEPTRFLDRTWNRFVGSEAIAEQVLPSFVVRGGRQGSLAVVLRGLFAQPRVPPAPGDGSIRVLAAPHRYGEVEAVLRDVRRRLADGMEAARILIVARDLGPYDEQIADVARRFRVPVEFRRGRPLLASGAVREVLALVRAGLEGLPAARIAAMADSDYFGIRRRTAAAVLERIGYVSEAVCPLETCLERWRLAAAADSESWRRRVASVAPGLTRLVNAVRAIGGTRSVPEHVRELRRALRLLGFRPVAREVADPDAAARDAGAWTRFDELLDGLRAVSALLDAGPRTLDDFLAMLLTTIELETVRETTAGGGVRALSVLDARGLDADLVYVLGLDDGTFPAPRRESAVLPDACKRALGPAVLTLVRARLGARATGLAGSLLRTAREATLEDPFLFFLALSFAEREVVLSHPTTDERGNATVRSPFVDEVEACLSEGLPEERIDAGRMVPERGDCCEEGELVARAALDRWSGLGSEADELTPALRTRLVNGPARVAGLDRRARVERARLGYQLTPLGSARDARADVWVGRVPATAALRRHIDAFVWSPTRLEELAACGFKFFAHRLLGARPRDETSPDVDARERGTLLHRLVEGVLRAVARWPHDPLAARQTARAAAAEVRRAVEAMVPPKERAVLDLEWQRALAVLDEVASVEAEEQRAADSAELRIERHLERRLELGGAGEVPALRLAGTADRIDLWWRDATLERLRVRDYKTARRMAEHRRGLSPPADGERRLAFQVPVYVMAAARAFGAGPAVDLTGGYWSLLALPNERECTRAFARDELDAVAREISALVETARDGVFDVAPHACGEWCPYRTVCRYQPPPAEDEHG